jgi:cell division protein FtsI/penicillin-binding protein 2
MRLKTRGLAWTAGAAVCLAACLTLWDTASAQSDAKSAGDTGLQQAVTRAMTGRKGTAVVVDVHSGQILAASHLDVAARRLVRPGSSIKTFTLLALLDAGKVDANTALVCKRPLTVGGHRLDCPHPVTPQPLDPPAALAYSCNFYFTQVGARLTPEQLRAGFVHDGFTSITGLVLNEATGRVELAQNAEQLELEAIGEWGIEVTPLELLQAYRNLAMHVAFNGDAKLGLVFAGLEGSAAYGMGHLAQPDSPMKVAAKTGTALSDEGAWTHAWLAGYAPANDPEIALVVFLEKGRGGVDAANVARAIFSTYATSRTASLPKSNVGTAR